MEVEVSCLSPLCLLLFLRSLSPIVRGNAIICHPEPYPHATTTCRLLPGSCNLDSNYMLALLFPEKNVRQPLQLCRSFINTLFVIKYVSEKYVVMLYNCYWLWGHFSTEWIPKQQCHLNLNSRPRGRVFEAKVVFPCALIQPLMLI